MPPGRDRARRRRPTSDGAPDGTGAHDEDRRGARPLPPARSDPTSPPRVPRKGASVPSSVPTGRTVKTLGEGTIVPAGMTHRGPAGRLHGERPRGGRRRKMKRLVGLAAIVVLAVTVAAAQGYGHGHGPNGEPGMILADHLTKRLDLTADQKAKVETIVSKYMEGALGDKMRSMQQAQSTLHRTIHDPAASDRQV